METQSNITYIKNKPNTVRLSDTLDELPKNCVFNKVTTGCGATHIALTNLEPTIVAVPYRVLVDDKVTDEQYKVVGMSCDYPVNSIAAGTFKIICTYQSLEKLSKLVDISKYTLIVDEAHLLIQNASFSPKAITWLMENFTKFKSFTFMSATLHDKDLWLPQLTHLPLVEMLWDTLKPVTFKPLGVYDTSLQDGLLNIILDHLDNTKEGNPYFFYNSLKGIVNIVKRLKRQKVIANKDIRIVCSPTNKNKKYLKDNLNLTIGKASDAPTKINFITSTAFEGVNFYDPNGVTYIISDKNSDFTKYDIVTTVPQIIGRIRDSLYKDIITIIYDAHTLKIGKTEQQIIEESVRKMEDATKSVRDYNTTDAEGTRKALLLWSLHSMYFYTDPEVLLDEDTPFDPELDFKTTELHVNSFAPLIERAFFKLINNAWHINVKNEKDGNKIYIKDKNHFTLSAALTETDSKLEPLSDKNKASLGSKISFRDLCELYEIGDIETVEKADPMVIEYYRVLTEAKIKAYSYNSSKIKKLYELEINKNTDIESTLKRTFKVGQTYKKSYIKKVLVDNNAPKKVATYLLNFFEVKTTTYGGEAAYLIIQNKSNTTNRIIKEL